MLKNAAAHLPDPTHRFSQEKLFYFLYEFALRTCYRYTSYTDNPESTVYEGFINLFRSIGHKDVCFGSLFAIRSELKRILIDACIRKGQLETREEGSYTEPDIAGRQPDREENLKRLSPREMIDALRMLPFPDRMIFNLAVMDGFTHHEIACKLQMPVGEVKANLTGAREKLNKALLHYNTKPV